MDTADRTGAAARVLLVGGAQELCAPADGCAVLRAEDLDAAEAAVRAQTPALIVLRYDVPDRQTLMRICALAQESEAVCLLLVGEDAYARVWPSARRAGVCVMTNPGDPAVLTQTVRNLLLLRKSMQSMQDRTAQLQTQLADLKRIQKAKALLMRQFGMSEAEAHRWIEKAAMDRCVKKREIAETVIRMYEI